MLEKLIQVEKRFEEIEKQLCQPEVISDRDKFTELSRERSDLEDLVPTIREYKKLIDDIEEYHKTFQSDDLELKELAEAELPDLKEKKAAIEEKIKILLLPKDPNDKKNIILEVRAGTGGEEASLFVADLFRMYSRFAEFSRAGYS